MEIVVRKNTEGLFEVVRSDVEDFVLFRHTEFEKCVQYIHMAGLDSETINLNINDSLS